jgi:hypothetical protein
MERVNDDDYLDDDDNNNMVITGSLKYSCPDCISNKKHNISINVNNYDTFDCSGNISSIESVDGNSNIELDICYDYQKIQYIPSVAIKGTLKFESSIEFSLATDKLNDIQITAVTSATCTSIELPSSACTFISQSSIQETNRRKLQATYAVVALIESKLDYANNQDSNILYISLKHSLESALNTDAFVNEVNTILIDSNATQFSKNDIIGVVIGGPKPDTIPDKSGKMSDKSYSSTVIIIIICV